MVERMLDSVVYFYLVFSLKYKKKESEDLLKSNI